MNRRSFLFYTMAITVSSGFGSQLALATSNDQDTLTIDLDKDLTSVGSSKKIKKVIVVRTAEGNETNSFIALSNKCTHRGCKVSFKPEQNRFECPCHGSMYDLNGEVIKGPAKKALTKYTVSLNNNTLIINTNV